MWWWTIDNGRRFDSSNCQSLFHSVVIIVDFFKKNKNIIAILAKALEEKERSDAATEQLKQATAAIGNMPVDHHVFLDMNPRVIAEALTLHSYKLFERIRTVEFFNEGWNKPQTQ